MLGGMCLMKNILPVVLLLALSGVPALAQNNQGQNNNRTP
jgi:hypothetical protein